MVLEPGNAALRLALGDAYLRQVRFEEAEAKYRLAADISHSSNMGSRKANIAFARGRSFSAPSERLAQKCTAKQA